ncbi:MAG: hypothetical protein Q8S33_10000 [Myxococcales bacterium]|nr:hypothetical protein [Myxococcales bacterium]
MRFAICLAVLVVSAACPQEVDPNGRWTGPDASVTFFDWDGGRYWTVGSIALRQSAILIEDDCSWYNSQAGRLTWINSCAPMTPAIASGSAVRLFVSVSESEVNEGYQIRHRDAGTVGLVRLSFDAGFFIEGPQRGVLRWRADYRDDVRQLESEGGELWVDRRQSDCR